MFLNLKTAKALGITVPLPLLGRADGYTDRSLSGWIAHHNQRGIASGLIGREVPALAHEGARIGGLEFEADQG